MSLSRFDTTHGPLHYTSKIALPISIDVKPHEGSSNSIPGFSLTEYIYPAEEITSLDKLRSKFNKKCSSTAAAETDTSDCTTEDLIPKKRRRTGLSRTTGLRDSHPPSRSEQSAILRDRQELDKLITAQKELVKRTKEAGAILFNVIAVISDKLEQQAWIGVMQKYSVYEWGKLQLLTKNPAEMELDLLQKMTCKSLVKKCDWVIRKLEFRLKSLPLYWNHKSETEGKKGEFTIKDFTALTEYREYHEILHSFVNVQKAEQEENNHLQLLIDKIHALAPETLRRHS